MSIKPGIVDRDGNLVRGVTTHSQCVYCSAPAVKYVWCKKHLTEMALIRRAVSRYVDSKGQ